MNSIDKKKFILFVAISVTGFVFFMWFVLFGIDKFFSPTVRALLNQQTFKNVTPGTTTTEKLSQTLGKPEGQEKSGSSDIIYYNSSQQYQYEYVWTKDGKVIATKERAKTPVATDKFISSQGSPDITLYDTTTEATWLIYLDKGIGGQNIGGQIYALLRFSPQSESEFMANISPSVGLSKTKPQNQNAIGD